MDHVADNAENSRPKLLVIIASTRPGRVGLPVGQWFSQWATAQGAFEVEVADLAEIRLPFMDEPNHPRLRKYTHQHTKDWSAKVESADAFVFVTPEYNHTMIAPLKNAIDFLVIEWQYKPLGFVSYGGISAGTRSVVAAKQTAVALKMMPIPEAVNVPMVQQFISDDGKFVPNEVTEQAATLMLKELARWTGALKTLRA